MDENESDLHTSDGVAGAFAHSGNPQELIRRLRRCSCGGNAQIETSECVIRSLVKHVINQGAKGQQAVRCDADHNPQVVVWIRMRLYSVLYRISRRRIL